VESNISDYTDCFHSSCFKRSVAGPLTSETRVRTQVIACEIPCGQSGTVTVFSPRTSVSPVSNISPMLHTPLHRHVALTRPGYLQFRKSRSVGYNNSISSQLMLYSEIIAVCSQIHTKHINIMYGQSAELLHVKLAVPIETRPVDIPQCEVKIHAHGHWIIGIFCTARRSARGE
jgi:hypothetical protein